MNLFKKVTATAALVALSSSFLVTGVSAYSATDVESANLLAGKNIIVDHSTNPAGYQLDRNVLRQEIAAVARGLAGLEKSTTCYNIFKDVSATTPNDWACNSVEPLAMQNLIAKNANFNPQRNITKAEAIAMVVKARYGSEYVLIPTAGSWESQVVNFAAQKGLVAPFTDYTTPATRGFIFNAAANTYKNNDASVVDNELCAFLPELCSTGAEDSSDNNSGSTGSDSSTAVTGEAEVTLSPNTPRAQNIPMDSENTEFLTFDVTAGKEDLRLNTITFKRSNLGYRDDFNRVWLTQDGVIVTRDKAISTDDTVTLDLNGKSIKAGTTETFTLNASMTKKFETVGGKKIYIGGSTVNQFSITNVNASSKVAVDNVMGNPMTTVNYFVSEIRIDAKGFATKVDVGTEKAIIWEFKLSETNSDSKKDVVIKAIRFKTVGGADLQTDFANLALYEGNKKVSTDAIINGKYVTFKLDNFILENGSSKFFTINADIVAWDDDDKVSFQLKDGFDIYALEKGTNVGAAFNEIRSDGNLKEYTLEAGKFIVSRDPSSPTSAYYLKSTSDVLAFVAKVDLGQPVSVDEMNLFLTSDSVIQPGFSLKDQVDNVSLYVNDTLVDSVDEATVSWGKTYYRFKTYFTLKDNDKISVRVNFTENAQVDTRIKFMLDNTGATKDGTTPSFVDVEYVSSGDNLKKAKMTGTAMGQFLTVKTAENSNIASNDGYAGRDSTMIAGETGVVFKKFVLSAPSTSSLNVRRLKFEVDYPNVAGLKNNLQDDNFGNFKILTNGKQVGDVATIVDKAITIDGVDTIIPRNGQQEFLLVGDVKSGDFSGGVSFKTLGSEKRGQSVFYDANGNELLDNSANGGVNNAIPTESGKIAVLRVVDNALLNIAAHGDMPKEQLIIADTKGSDIATYKFTSQYGQVGVEELSVELDGSGSIDSVVNSLDVYANGKLIRSKIAPTIGTNKIVLGANDRINIPADKDTIISVKANLNNVDATDTGTKIFIKKVTVDKAVTLATGNEFANKPELAYTTKPQYIVKSQPVIAGVNVPTKKLTAGVNTVFKFTVAADSASDITVGKLTFNAIPNKVTPEKYELFVDGARQENFTGTGGTQTNNTLKFVSQGSVNDIIVTKGTSKTFEVRVTLDNTDSVADGDSIKFDFTDAGSNFVKGDFGNVNGPIVWSDNSGNPHTRNTQDWFNGFKVKGLSSVPSVTLEK